MFDSKLTKYEEALELSQPWQIFDRHFSKEAGRLDIFIKVDTNSSFTCSVCNTDGQHFYEVDQGDQTWRHLDFFQYKAYLHAPHPRVYCTVCDKVKYALVPWICPA